MSSASPAPSLASLASTSSSVGGVLSRKPPFKLRLPATSTLWRMADITTDPGNFKLYIPTTTVTSSSNKKGAVKLRCPKCHLTMASRDMCRKHITEAHLKPWMLRDHIHADTHWQPAQLLDTTIRVEKGTNLAVCLWMNCFLLQSEIAPHCEHCQGCKYGANFMVEDDSFLDICNDKRVQVRETRSRPMIGMDINPDINCRSCSGRGKASIGHRCSKFTDHGNNNWIHVQLDTEQCLELAHSLVEVIPVDEPSDYPVSFEQHWKKMVSQKPVADLISECIVLLDDCTQLMHHRLARRWKDSQLTMDSSQQRYAQEYAWVSSVDGTNLDFTIAMDIEFGLERLHNKRLPIPSLYMPIDHQYDKEDRRQLGQHQSAARDMAERLYLLLLRVLSRAIPDISLLELQSGMRVANTNQHLSFGYESNRVYLNYHAKRYYLPWCVGELFVRYMVGVLPMLHHLRVAISEFTPSGPSVKPSTSAPGGQVIIHRVNMANLTERVEDESMSLLEPDHHEMDQTIGAEIPPLTEFERQMYTNVFHSNSIVPI